MNLQRKSIDARRTSEYSSNTTNYRIPTETTSNPRINSSYSSKNNNTNAGDFTKKFGKDPNEKLNLITSNNNFRPRSNLGGENSLKVESLMNLKLPMCTKG